MESQSDLRNQKTPVNVKALVGRLLSLFQPLAVKKRSLILNDIPPDMQVNADLVKLARIITSLLDSIFDKSANCCIRITARRYRSVVLFRLSHSNGTRRFTPDPHWQEVNRLASKLGGCVMDNDLRRSHATVTFSFLSHPA